MFFSKNFHPKFYITPDVSPGTQRALRGSTFDDLKFGKLHDLRPGDRDPKRP